MKILHIIASLNPAHGGPVHGLHNYIPEFYERGMKNEILCLDDPSEPFIINNSFPIVHALGPSKRPWCYAPRLIPWLKEKMSNFDVILIHGLWLYHGYAVNKAVKYFNKKNQKSPRYYVICHGMLDPYFQKAAERKWKALRNYIYWNLIESNVIKNANGVLFTCEEELRLAEKTFTTYHPRAEKNIGYGVSAPPAYDDSMSEALWQACPAIKNKPFFLFLSRLHKKKGIDLLIKAFEEIHATKKPETVLLIAGPGLDTAYGREIRELVNQSKVKDFIFLQNMLSGDAKWGAFYNCEAFVLPSHQENFGIAVVEALGCSKPVLISDKVNIWKEIEDSQAGFIAGDTLEGTKDLLNKWSVLSGEEKIKMQQNANECFQANFAIKPAVTRLIKSIS